MSVLIFDRSVRCRQTAYGRISEEDAEVIAGVAIACDDIGDKFSAICFMETTMPTISELRFRCFGTPFVLDDRSIEVDSGYDEDDIAVIQFSAVQTCVYFADCEDLDIAALMAQVAAITDSVEPIETLASILSETENTSLSSIATHPELAPLLATCAAH